MQDREPLGGAHRALELESAMRRAIALAGRGPADDPNPQVGCVVLDPQGRIVAEGWHRGAGTPHAEVDALTQLPSEWRDRTAELTAVVTLEPCAHFGRTAPCAQMFIDAGIGSVVYAVDDPSPVAGGGAGALRASGVEVIGGLLAEEARPLLEHDPLGFDSPTARSTSGSRPHVTVKWAQTLDARAAAADGSSRWITGPEARADVHRRRAEADAILIGTGTLHADDPALTARDDDGMPLPAERQPVPVVLGRRPIPAGARVREHPALAARGLDEPIRLAGDDLAADLAGLADRGIRSVFVEGGPAVAGSFIEAGLADELLVYVAPALLGGPRLAIGDIGVESMAGIKRLRFTRIERLGDDLLITSAQEGI